MTELLEWLTATLDDVEQAARAAIEPSEMHPYGDSALPRMTPEQVPDAVRNYLGGTWAEHFALHDPLAVLASLEADRAILALHAVDARMGWDDPRCLTCTEEVPPCRTVLLVASRYRHRPGWRPEWLPDGRLTG